MFIAEWKYLPKGSVGIITQIFDIPTVDNIDFFVKFKTKGTIGLGKNCLVRAHPINKLLFG